MTEREVIQSAQRLVLEPNDVLVVTFQYEISDEAASRIRKQIKEVLGENRQALLLSDGMRISALSVKD